MSETKKPRRLGAIIDEYATKYASEFARAALQSDGWLDCRPVDVARDQKVVALLCMLDEMAHYRMPERIFVFRPFSGAPPTCLSCPVRFTTEIVPAAVLAIWPGRGDRECVPLHGVCSGCAAKHDNGALVKLANGEPRQRPAVDQPAPGQQVDDDLPTDPGSVSALARTLALVRVDRARAK